MDIKPIRNDDEYEQALAEIERLFGAPPETPEADKLQVLGILVEAYESENHPFPPPDPIEAIKYWMESRGKSRRDLEPFIGSRARVSEILNRKRLLTLRMIQNLEEGTGIPAEILVKRYPLVETLEGPSSTERLLESSSSAQSINLHEFTYFRVDLQDRTFFKHYQRPSLVAAPSASKNIGSGATRESYRANAETISTQGELEAGEKLFRVGVESGHTPTLTKEISA